MFDTKIKFVQLDPFGFCNAKCWFCPVKYYDQPEEGSDTMPIQLVEKIISEIYNEKTKKDGIVDPNFNLITLSHYNEILLYKHFDQLLEILRKYKFTCFILSNGISLSKQKVDLLTEYKDVVTHVGLNVPAFEKELWAKRSGFSEDLFDRLLQNLKYAEQKLSYLGHQLQISVNGIDTNPFDGGYVFKGPQFDDQDYDLDPLTGEQSKQIKLVKSMFPGYKIEKNDIIDRAGSINHILTNKPFVDSRLKNKRVIGCNNGGDRSTEWLNINSAGSVFLCCNDYKFEYKFGDLTKQTIKEVWESQLRKDVIKKAYSEICTHCIFSRVE